MYKFISYFAQLDTTSLPQGAKTDGAKLVTVINTALGTVASVAVVIIVYAGIKYIISRGDPQNITKAKNTILYALVGLVITMSATVLVNFVLRGL